MLKFLKWIVGAVGAVLMFATSVSPEEAGSRLAAWVKLLGWENPSQWLAIPSADTWGFWAGFLLLSVSMTWFMWPSIISYLGPARTKETPLQEDHAATLEAQGEIVRLETEIQELGSHVPVRPISEPKYNWRIDEALDFVAGRLGLVSEESKKYITPTRLLTRQARAGKIHVWGKRISDDGTELEGREIKAEEWRNRELVFEAWTPSTRTPQTRSVIGSPDDYQFTDLHVNATEIKAINWQSENAPLYT